MKARFLSKIFDPRQRDQNVRCISFWYNLFGLDIGELKVKLKDVRTGNEKILWKVSGNRGNNWKQAYVTIKSARKYKVI